MVIVFELRHVFDTRRESIFSNALSELQLAITHFKDVEINYCKANNLNISFRKIEPYAILFADHKCIMVAWCHCHNVYRAFRIDRIQHFKILQDNSKIGNSIYRPIFNPAHMIWRKMRTKILI